MKYIARNLMEYKGFLGTIEFSAGDNIMFGKVQGVNASITYEGETINDLISDFHDAIEDYLDYCKEKGIEPERAFKGSFNVRLDPELHRRAAIKAAVKGISLNSFVEESIRHSLEMSGD